MSNFRQGRGLKNFFTTRIFIEPETARLQKMGNPRQGALKTDRLLGGTHERFAAFVRKAA
jgi:hypothetical protein